MDFVGKADPDLVEDVDDGVPAVGEIGVARLNDFVVNRRVHGYVVPYGRSSESDHGLDTKGSGRARRGLHLLSSPLTNPLGITVTPDPWVDHVLVAVVDDRLTHCLAIVVI